MIAKTARQNTAAKKPARKRAESKPAKSAADVWKEEMDRAEAVAAKPYTLDGRYEEGEKVDHRSFGLGMVKKLISPDKMEVLFEDELKLMIRGVAPALPQSETARQPRRVPWARRQMPSFARAAAQDPDSR
jgi:hypothetical protein